jgi:hypothetical protein
VFVPIDSIDHLLCVLILVVLTLVLMLMVLVVKSLHI